MFEPWIGSNYTSIDNMFNGVKVLALGESTKDASHEIGAIVPSITRETIIAYNEHHANSVYVRWMRTFDNFRWAIMGTGADSKDDENRKHRTHFWDELSFYNYVTVVAANEARVRPSKTMFADGKQPFEQVLERLSPNIVVVWGYDLFGWVIRNHYPEFEKPWDFTGDWIDLPRKPLVRFVRFMHPAAAFSYSRHADICKRALSSYPKA